MRAEIKYYTDMWQEIKDEAMFTIGKDTGKYPDSKWKKQMLLCEHSPIRLGKIIVTLYDVPSFVIGHLVRHNIGFIPFVSTLREDRVDYEEIPNRITPNSMRFEGNFQSFINISRKRLCSKASKETIVVWKTVLDCIKDVEPELYSICVTECIYRGFCPEMKSCGFSDGTMYQKKLEEYRMR